MLAVAGAEVLLAAACSKREDPMGASARVT